MRPQGPAMARSRKSFPAILVLGTSYGSKKCTISSMKSEGIREYQLLVSTCGYINLHVVTPRSPLTNAAPTDGGKIALGS